MTLGRQRLRASAGAPRREDRVFYSRRPNLLDIGTQGTAGMAFGALDMVGGLLAPPRAWRFLRMPLSVWARLGGRPSSHAPGNQGSHRSEYELRCRGRGHPACGNRQERTDCCEQTKRCGLGSPAKPCKDLASS